MKIDLDDKVVRFLVQDYVNHICHYQSPEELNFDVHKLIHTFGVVEMAQKLIKITKPALSLKLQKQILNAAVLHDLGRSHEFKNGIHLKNIDHGKLGADLIKKYFPQMKIEAQSTLYHNKLPSVKDPQMAQPVLDYVRDADMLANLQYNMNHFDVFIAHIYGKKIPQFSKAMIDTEIVKAVQEKRPADVKNIKNHDLLTPFLWQLCWCFNLCTKSGKTLARKMNIFICFKKFICQKIIPLVEQDKKKADKLIKQIDGLFTDKIFTT